MVSATKHLGADLGTYLDPSHTLQKRNVATVSRFSGVPPKRIGLGTDGCSAPTFAIPLEAMARGMAALALEEGPARRVRESMMAHPGMVGRPCVNVMSAAPGRIVARRACDSMMAPAGIVVCPLVNGLSAPAARMVSQAGAEGVYLCGLVGRDIGMALKIEDGSARPWLPLLASVFRRLLLLSKDDLSRLEKASDGLLRNHAGLAVGEIRVVL
jgi:L-asparaginase II